MNIEEIVRIASVAAIPMVLAVTGHEVAHAYAAKRNGDYSAELAGRLTLNPLAHIDWLGTVILPLVLLSLHSPFLFGWAKPVPVDPKQFNNYRKGLRQVALSGIIANLLMTLVWAFLLVSSSHINVEEDSGLFALLVSFIREMSEFGVVINTVLAIFNLIPIPPLDGSRVISSFLKGEIARHYQSLEPYGFWVILFLMFSGLFRWLGPIVGYIVSLSVHLFEQLFHFLV
ncbi:MAG: site-2 protease family protein [Neisseriaceae bacterium]